MIAEGIVFFVTAFAIGWCMRRRRKTELNF